MLTLVLDGLVLLTAIAGPVLVRDRTTGSAPPAESARRLGPAPVWLGAVTIAIFVNQVLFTAYVIRRHQGDATFIARYLPDGWFDTATGNPAMRALAGAIPDPGLLGVTVLRVQAFLELPFVLLAYLTVAGWLGLDLRRPRVLWAASVAYTVVFGAIELSLPNPYTQSDLIMRVASALLTPVLLTRLSPPGPGRDDLLRFALSAAALATLVLVIYDTALLYNLGRVSRDLPTAAAAAGLLAMSRWYARRDRNPPGPVGLAATTALATWLAWFFVPALAIRYALGFGTRWLALVTAVALAAGAAIVALRGTDRPGALIALGGAGTLAAGATAMTIRAIGLPYPEARLLIAAGAAAAVVIVGTWWMDRLAAEGGSGLGP